MRFVLCHVNFLQCAMLLSCAVLLPGCSDGVSEEGGSQGNTLPDAGATEVGLAKTPVMPGSTLIDLETEQDSADDAAGGTFEYTRKNWTYDIDATLAEIQAFFVAKYPDAEVDEYVATSGDPDDESDTQMTVPPAPGVEKLVIRIYDNRYVIGEATRD